MEKYLKNLTPLELHNLLYDVLEKLAKLPYVYDEENRITHSSYFVSNVKADYDCREEIERSISKYGND